HPQVHWSQRHEHVTLVADVFDLKEYSVEVKNDSKVVAFSASDKADKQYVFELELYGAVSADKIKKSSTGRQVVIQLDKLEQVWWPRLTKAASKTAWVKTDFARWKDEDESESE
ncbi:HSP20-like chaperone, partial [Ramicandelaber brevisporus]